MLPRDRISEVPTVGPKNSSLVVDCSEGRSPHQFTPMSGAHQAGAVDAPIAPVGPFIERGTTAQTLDRSNCGAARLRGKEHPRSAQYTRARKKQIPISTFQLES